jgi:hypothetical protein
MTRNQCRRLHFLRPSITCLASGESIRWKSFNGSRSLGHGLVPRSPFLSFCSVIPLLSQAVSSTPGGSPSCQAANTKARASSLNASAGLGLAGAGLSHGGAWIRLWSRTVLNVASLWHDGSRTLRVSGQAPAVIPPDDRFRPRQVYHHQCDSHCGLTPPQLQARTDL